MSGYKIKVTDNAESKSSSQSTTGKVHGKLLSGLMIFCLLALYVNQYMLFRKVEIIADRQQSNGPLTNTENGKERWNADVLQPMQQWLERYEAELKKDPELYEIWKEEQARYNGSNL